jgi:4-hydroxybenzoate polyprenyltransferase
MTPRRAPGTLTSLLLACHPAPTAAMTLALGSGAALSGRGAVQSALVAATVLSGQLTVGWVNDLVDADRDREAGRTDKPVAQGLVPRSTVVAATGAVVPVVVVLSLANGTESGLAHLAAVASAWVYDLPLKRTAFSWLPYAVSFGLLPAFLSYGGLGFGTLPGSRSAPPTAELTVLAGLMGVGIHLLNTLPDLAEDEANGLRHLPLRLAGRLGRRRLRTVSVGFTAAVAVGMAVSARTVGLRRPALDSRP